MKEKSIDLEHFLPFKEDSEIVHTASDIKIEDNIPVLEGATALYPIYAAYVETLYPEESVKFNGNEFEEDSFIQKTGTTKAYQRIVDGDVDVIFCAGPSKNQEEYAKEKGVELELVPIGKEAFVFIVNSNNKVDNLSIDEIKDIYQGKIKRWNEVGGENTPIIALQRAEGSGSQTAMLSFMKGENLKKSGQMFIGRTIGFSFRYYVERIVADGNLKMLSINGIAPTKDNIKNESYPITNTFYMIYRKDNENPNIKVLKDFVLSKEGQKIIDDTGYVAINN
jgi:phosphate transport system substrate-binding protein